jgi:hypothetical protein
MILSCSARMSLRRPGRFWSHSIVALVDGRFQSLCVIGEVFEHRKLSMGRAFDVLLGFVAFAQKLNLLPAILFAARDPSGGQPA